MQEFLLVFRRDFSSGKTQVSPEAMQAMLKPWQDWMNSLNKQDKLVSAGNRLVPDGLVVRSKELVTDGPYVDTKEAIGGYLIVRAASIEAAAELAKGCPILDGAGNVEVRAILGSGKAFLEEA